MVCLVFKYLQLTSYRRTIGCSAPGVCHSWDKPTANLKSPLLALLYICKIVEQIVQLLSFRA